MVWTVVRFNVMVAWYTVWRGSENNQWLCGQCDKTQLHITNVVSTGRYGKRYVALTVILQPDSTQSFYATSQGNVVYNWTHSCTENQHRSKSTCCSISSTHQCHSPEVDNAGSTPPKTSEAQFFDERMKNLCWKEIVTRPRREPKIVVVTWDLCVKVLVRIADSVDWKKEMSFRITSAVTYKRSHIELQAQSELQAQC